MLDTSALGQLKQLKQDIEDSKEFAEGIVKGTQRRFGFVILEDGREIFLAPAEMDKLFPGDQVKIQIHTDKKGKQSAELLNMIKSPLQTFTGRYVVKGKGHFVEPDVSRFNRWIFIPPNSRAGAKDGDYIRCKISRHAYPTAKPQAKVIALIGSDEQIGIEADYAISKFELGGEWPENWQASLNDVDNSTRQDLTELPLLTIDAASTLDMDDALHAVATDSGWSLTVAIADPDALFSAGSPLDLEARRRATSVYMSGQTVPMLPAELSTGRCSLSAGEQRPALACRMEINREGVVSNFNIIEASVCSQAKLSYREVSSFLDSNEALENSELESTIKALNNAASALLLQRQRDHLIVKGRAEFHLRLNEQRKIDHIETASKSSAHQLVEECMVAANRCAAEMMAEQGLFNGHAGFRPERLEGVNKLVAEQLSITDVDFSGVDGYRSLINSIDDEKLEFPLRSVLSRMLERGKISTQPLPHFGMGLERYTTFTSPIRKYSDLLVQRQIKARIRGEQLPCPSDSELQQLQQALDGARQARQQMEQWLKCQYLLPLQGQVAQGVISQINSNGYTVRLENGVEGFVETKPLKEKYSFDPMRLRLSSKSETLELDQVAEVLIEDVNVAERRISFTQPPIPE